MIIGRDRRTRRFFTLDWGRYLEHVASFSLPEEKRFRQVHDGHCTYMQPGEEAFVTPEAIHGTCVAGTPEDIAHQLTQMERNGLTGISLLPPAESQRKVFRTSPKW